MKEYAIVTDGLWRKSISAIRSLGKKNINVTVMGENNLATGMWSKFCSKRYVSTLASKDTSQFGKDLITLINQFPNKPVILPMEEPTLYWCCENYKLISDKAYLLLPSLESLKIALSKAETMKLAMLNDIPCPKTLFPKDSNELREIINKYCSDEFVIKPYHGSGSSGIIYGDKIDVDLTEHWNRYGNLIFQERIPSEGFGCGMSFLMDSKSNVIAYFGHKRLEQYPNSGGPSTQRIGYKDQSIYNYSVKLLKKLNWVGVAMVEWKYNPKTKQMALMEINPRFWGSLELAVRSNVDFPYLYYKLAKKEMVSPINDYRTDVICRWLIPGDILRYITKKNHESLGKFLKGSLKESEEWDKRDKRCFFASFICQGLLVLNPKYWKYVRR